MGQSSVGRTPECEMIHSGIEFSRKEVVAENGVVVGGHELVAKTGVEIMQQGGNAVDAGVAAAFVAQLAEPGMCGVGGNGSILVRSADRDEIAVFDDGPRAPRAATPNMFEVLPGSGGFYGWDNVKDNANIVGHLSVGMPGTVAGLCAAHERYGSLELADVLAPAIELAERGVEVDSRTATYVAREVRNFGRFPLLGALLLADGHPPSPGTFWSPGDRLVWPELADTYRTITDGGADAFYRGPIARAIAAEMARHGGIITYEDMAEYASAVNVLDDRDLHEYRGLRYTPGLSVIVVQMLNILESFDLAAMGPDSPPFRHVMLETMRRVWTNHFTFGAQPGALTKEYAAEVAGTISLDRASSYGRPVEPWHYQEDEQREAASSAPARVGGDHTTTLAAADRAGNVFNMLTSLGRAFGSNVVIPGTGIIMNDHMCSWDPVPGRALSLGPSRRSSQGTHLPMFFRDGRPFLAMSAAGARRSMSSVIHTLVHCVDFGMGIQEAIESPRVWSEALFDDVFVDSRIPESVQRTLADMGHGVVSVDAAVHSGFGRPTAVGIDADGRLHGGADPMYGTAVAGF
ncbi:MAG: gamma-glutamyltransferase [Chloroflexi bacterium]|nr:gamma-glutamyltransferase [Chloroflexota bacterium]